MSKPRIADLFCGAGGAGMGLHRAGFEVVGFDIEPQPNYPFEFHQGDALEVDLSGFDAVWASPPCQAYSIMLNLPWLRDREYPALIGQTREHLEAAGVPYIIENVMGAVYKGEMQAGWLCGAMFGLPFYRHRAFETDWFWLAPGHPKHTVVIGSQSTNRPRRSETFVHPNPVNSEWRKHHDGNGAQRVGVGIGHAAGWKIAAQAMGIDWMKRDELTQAIPPAYSEYLGKQLLNALRPHEEAQLTT